MIHLNETAQVARISGLLALECGKSPTEVKNIRIAALLHDIGKQQIPEQILNKPGKLTSGEFEIIKTHTKLGARMLASLQGYLGKMVQNVCLYHHEKWNGLGYWGKRLGELPDYIQMVALADVYVALTSARPYKKAYPPEDALMYIRRQSGKQFGPEEARRFISLILKLLQDSGYFQNK
jgi:putative two-component system response regulator